MLFSPPAQVLLSKPSTVYRYRSSQCSFEYNNEVLWVSLYSSKAAMEWKPPSSEGLHPVDASHVGKSSDDKDKKWLNKGLELVRDNKLGKDLYIYFF